MSELPITLQQLQLLIEVAESGSFTTAAERSAYSQPTISKQIGALQSSIGLRLFEQSANRTVLTAAGDQLIGPARACLEAAEGFLATADRIRSEPAGELAIGATPTLSASILPPIVGDFHTRFPAVHLRLSTGTTVQLQREVEAGSMDCAFVVGPVVDRPDLLKTTLMVDDLVLIVPPNHRWARRKQVRVEDLRDARLVVRERGSAVRALLEQALREAGVELNVAFETNDTVAVKWGVRSGLGESLISRLAVGPELAAGHLVALDIEPATLKAEYLLVSKRSRSVSRALEEFLRSARNGGDSPVASRDRPADGQLADSTSLVHSGPHGGDREE